MRNLLELMIHGSDVYHDCHEEKAKLRNVEYSHLVVMSELSTVRCDRVLNIWLQVHGCRVSTESCRGGTVAIGPCGGRR